MLSGKTHGRLLPDKLRQKYLALRALVFAHDSHTLCWYSPILARNCHAVLPDFSGYFYSIQSGGLGEDLDNNVKTCPAEK